MIPISGEPDPDAEQALRDQQAAQRQREYNRRVKEYEKEQRAAEAKNSKLDNFINFLIGEDEVNKSKGKKSKLFQREMIAFLVGGVVTFFVFNTGYIANLVTKYTKKMPPADNVHKVSSATDIQILLERTVARRKSGPTGVIDGDTLEFKIPINQLPTGVDAENIKTALSQKERAMQKYKAYLKKKQP